MGSTQSTWGVEKLLHLEIVNPPMKDYSLRK